MAQFRKSENPDQGFLLPPSPRDWLPQGHLAWFIQDAVAALDIDKLIDAYRVCGKGELPYPPKVMLQLLIYAYSTGTFSSRKIAAQLEDSIAFRVLAEGHTPSYRTISGFARRTSTSSADCSCRSWRSRARPSWSRWARSRSTAAR
jgi:transposase